jgi:hypothetical protein
MIYSVKPVMTEDLCVVQKEEFSITFYMCYTMEMKQMFEWLLAGQAEMVARLDEKMDDYHKKRMAMFDAYEKRMIACLGQTEDKREKTVPDSEMM